MNGVFLQQLKLSGKKCFARGNSLGCAMLLIFCQLRQIFAHIHKLHQHLHLQITPHPLFPSIFLSFFLLFLEARSFRWCQMKTECQVGCKLFRSKYFKTYSFYHFYKHRLFLCINTVCNEHLLLIQILWFERTCVQLIIRTFRIVRATSEHRTNRHPGGHHHQQEQGDLHEEKVVLHQHKNKRIFVKR